MQLFSCNMISNDKVSTTFLREDFFQYMIIVKGIARVHKNEIFPFCNTNTFVHAVINAIVLLRDPIVDVISILLNDFFTAIGRPSVNDYKFIIIKTLLADDTFDRISKAFFMIKIYCNNG